jgi:hypothetical protein
MDFVFVSHSAKDKVLADSVVQTLEESGIKCWVAPRDIPPGGSWAKSIVDAIRECKLFVLVFSSNANDSPHVLREVERAVHNRVPIVPVRTEDAVPAGDLEYFISTPHWLDATPARRLHAMKLLIGEAKKLCPPTILHNDSSSGGMAGPHGLATKHVPAYASKFDGLELVLNRTFRIRWVVLLTLLLAAAEFLCPILIYVVYFGDRPEDTTKRAYFTLPPIVLGFVILVLSFRYRVPLYVRFVIGLGAPAALFGHAALSKALGFGPWPFFSDSWNPNSTLFRENLIGLSLFAIWFTVSILTLVGLLHTIVRGPIRDKTKSPGISGGG